MPDWFEQSIVTIPLFAAVYMGLGVPYALLLLPRPDWSMRTVVIALAFALGPGLLTAWLFMLGTVGAMMQTPLLRFDMALSGALIIAALGYVALWRKWRITPKAQPAPRSPLQVDERLIIALIIVAVLLRWWVTMYWPFTGYDALWVYGYQGRLYTLTGWIPNTIDYYPQFLPLQYTFAQLAVGGIDDHAARMVIPFLHIGSILAAFTLGRLLFNRRTGFIMAAIWALYPHVAQWAYIGDLEIPLAFLFTLSAAFFLQAWLTAERATRRRYALIAGVVFGIAMWTKPTAGAFIWGVVLLVIMATMQALASHDWTTWRKRFEVAAITGLACIPLGAIWYGRNLLLGHEAIRFPHESWLTRATRSGDLFGWLLLALAVLLIYVTVHRHHIAAKPLTRRSWAWIAAGLACMAMALLPSVPWFNRWLVDLAAQISPLASFVYPRIDPPQSHLQAHEWVLLGFGVALIAWALRHLRPLKPAQPVMWAYALALPYAMTWFYSYSYHARLSFAIVPLLILPTAALVAHWLKPHQWPRRWVWAYSAVIILIGSPGIAAAYLNIAPHNDWLWTDRYANDWDKYLVHNPGITLVAQAIHAYIQTHEQEPVIIAPGEDRLPFFFPQLTIDVRSLPTRLDDLRHATHYLYGSQMRWRYENANIAPQDNQIVSSLARTDIMQQVLRYADGTFRYELYELDLHERFVPPTQHEDAYFYFPPENIVFGDVIRFWGGSASSRQLLGSKVFTDWVWQPLQPLAINYMIQVRLYHPATGREIYAWDAPVAPNEHAPQGYGTHLWQADKADSANQVNEIVIDRRVFQLTPELIAQHNIPLSNEINNAISDDDENTDYRLLIRFVDPQTGQALPVTINGEPVGDGYLFFSPVYVGQP